MGKKKKQNQKGGPATGGGPIKQIGTTKKFQPDTLTKRLEQRKSAQKHKRQNGFEQIKCLSDLVASAAQRTTAFEREEAASAENDSLNVKDGIKRSFYKEFRKVVGQADVVLQVLDVRDPEGCRCFDAETAVLSDYNKRLILVLNKIDLVPFEVAEAWHTLLSKQFPTVMFKANTQTQRNRLQQSSQDVKAMNHKALSSSACVGARELTKLLVNYTRNKGIRTSIRVGVIGLPNVGKSSLINSLLRSRSCNVGAVPGVTKTIQEVLLDKKIKLLDSPGVVLAQNVGPLATIQNSVKLDSLEDPVQPIALILQHCGREQILQHYKIEPFETPSQLLALLAFKFGKLMGGGVPDINAAARVLLRDWNAGSVQFYTKPPQDASLPSHVSSSVVGGWAAEFSMPDEIKVEEDTRMEDKSAASNPELTVVFKTDKREKEPIDRICEDKPYEMGQLQHGKIKKQRHAALKKSRKRMDKLGDMFDSAMNNMMDCDDDSDDTEM